MSGQIFNIQDDGTLVEMAEQPFATENLFQELLAKYPNLLAGDQIDSASPRKWLLVKREMGVPGEEEGADRWSLDHLFLDQDAIPTLVEVKRSSDTRLRREVVAQMLDYAANAVLYWPVEQLRVEFENNSDDPVGALEKVLGNGADPNKFWQKVKTNLQAGKIRMLFVADVIPPELKRIVEFLNEQMDPAEVLAVEIKHYVGQGIKTLVPRLIGQTAEAATRKGSRSSDPPTFENILGYFEDDTVKQVFTDICKDLATRTIDLRPLTNNWISLWYKGKQFAYLGVKKKFFVVTIDSLEDGGPGRTRITTQGEWKAFFDKFVAPILQHLEQGT